MAFILSDSASGTDLSSCICPPRCTNFVYEATVSSSLLSDMMMRHGKNNSQIGRRYVNAVETRNRVASSLLSDIIGHLEKVLTAYQRLKATLAIDLVEHATSVPGQIHASINAIVQKTQDSLAEFSSQIADKFIVYYEQNIDFIVTQLIRTAKSLLTHQFYIMDINAYNLNARRVEKIFHHKNATCKAAEAFGEVVFEVPPGVNFSADLLIDRTCELEKLGHLFDYCRYSESGILTENNTEYINKLIDLVQQMTVATRTVLRCVPMYSTFLNDVQSWLKVVLNMNSSLPLKSEDRRYVMMELDHELKWLKEISRKFAKKTVVRSFPFLPRDA